MLKLINHPLITHKLSLIRRKETGTRDFRQNVSEIAGLMAYEITRDLPLREIVIDTPLSSCKTAELSREIILVPVLRAGLGMVDGITSLITTARVGHIGLVRDHETLVPTEYYAKFPADISDAVVMVLDPMLATGGSASAAIDAVKKRGAKTIRLVCIVGAPEGVARMEREHPEVDIYLAALDSHLNENGYIVPGLGDAGDRLFGTV
ncbi:MAG: uracil phosphoribosyltransferase [Bacteroidota bacterium]|nr:uracil phosphoribosyltransferase [Bacteroidota bacterium]